MSKSDRESETDRMSKRVREREGVCESKVLLIGWSSDPVIKGSSDQVIKQLSDKWLSD